MKLIAYADGASRGNPGPAAFGAVVYDESGRELKALSRTIGRGTNNEAEYLGAIAALEAALELGATEVELRLDSELVVRQIAGSYRIRHPRLQPLYARLQALGARLQSLTVRHVRREENRRADRLANMALDSDGTARRAAGPGQE